MDNKKFETESEYDNEDYPVKVSFMELRPSEESTGVSYEPNDSIEVLIVNNGSLRILSEDIMETVSAGKGVLINSNVAHRRIPKDNAVCAFYSLKFKPEFIIGDSDRMKQLYLNDFTSDTALRVLVLNEDNLKDESLLDGFNRVIAANLIHKAGYELLTKSLLCTLWISLMEYSVQNVQAYNGRNMPSTDERRVKTAVEYIEEHYAEMISLDEIADNIHISKSECCRCFQRVLFMTPFEYLMQYRIYSALKILYKNPEASDSMNDLSFLCGFNTPSYFNRIFRKYLQITPSAFKKLAKTDPEEADRLYTKIQNNLNLLM